MTSQKRCAVSNVQRFSSKSKVNSLKLLASTAVPKIVRYAQHKHLLGIAATVGGGLFLYGGSALCASNLDLSKSSFFYCVFYYLEVTP